MSLGGRRSRSRLRAPASGRFDEEVRGLERSVIESPGDVDPELRRRVADRAAALALGGEPPGLLAALVPFVDKVALHAYKVVDEDVDRLRAAGYSEDAIFEVTVSAALGAGLCRLERGLAVLRESERP